MFSMFLMKTSKTAPSHGATKFLPSIRFAWETQGPVKEMQWNHMKIAKTKELAQMPRSQSDPHSGFPAKAAIL